MGTLPLTIAGHCGHEMAVHSRYEFLGGTLVASNAVEQLGRFVLANNAVINLAGDAAQLNFADSSGEDWNSEASLVISNWTGSLLEMAPSDCFSAQTKPR